MFGLRFSFGGDGGRGGGRVMARLCFSMYIPYTLYILVSSPNKEIAILGPPKLWFSVIACAALSCTLAVQYIEQLLSHPYGANVGACP